ncbi:MAG: hypothetical protein ISR76_05830 [Planctomycetes bacterium]|nr:hypothetical protein [Planctomycetota bacterium]MBL7008498.1 hypothetical protein [Planctomycetota bacterium]
MRRSWSVLLLLAPLVTACAAHFTSGEVNGVSYWMSLDREAVPGGVPHGIEIRMFPGIADRGRLRVDGVDYGEVRTGDQVRVTDAAIVLVNGAARQPRREG